MADIDQAAPIRPHLWAAPPDPAEQPAHGLILVDWLEPACLQDGGSGGGRYKANERPGGVRRLAGRDDSGCHQGGVLNLAGEWTGKIDAGRDDNLGDLADLHFDV